MCMRQESDIWSLSHAEGWEGVYHNHWYPRSQSVWYVNYDTTTMYRCRAMSNDSMISSTYLTC